MEDEKTLNENVNQTNETAKVDKKEEKLKRKEEKKTLKEKRKNILKNKIKELSDINTDEAIEFSFKIDSKARRQITTIVVLFFLILIAVFIKYSSGNTFLSSEESPIELNSYLHMNNVLLYPKFDDMLENKKIFKDTTIYAEAIIKEIEQETVDGIKLKVSLSKTEDKIAYLYYVEDDKDNILVDSEITFIGKINLINTNKNFIEIEAVRIDTGNGLFSEEDLKDIAALYAGTDDIKLQKEENMKEQSYGFRLKNFIFPISKISESNFPNELRIIDSLLSSDIVDRLSETNKIYTKIDLNETADKIIKMKKDFVNKTFTLEVYNKRFDKLFDKTWKNIHTNDIAAYDYISKDGNFYINIENAIYVFNEETGEELKIDVTGKGYITVDFKGNIYYLSIEDDGYVAQFDRTGSIRWKEPLVSHSDQESFEVREIREIIVKDNSEVIAEFEASEVFDEYKNKEEIEFVKFKAMTGIRVDDTI